MGADIEGICRQAAMLAIRDYLERNGGQESDERPLEITMRHFRAALPTVTDAPEAI